MNFSLSTNFEPSFPQKGQKGTSFGIPLLMNCTFSTNFEASFPQIGRKGIGFGIPLGSLG